jgi:hypothetical protein
VELKTVEEMLVMKKCELKDFDADVDSEILPVNKSQSCKRSKEVL